ncbi:MAG: hypothetical protein AABX71_01165 [Nanoarchaeota archaeon]
MLPKHHMIVGFIVVLILFLSGMSLIPCLIIFSSSVLIDIDHYFFYVWKRRDFSLKNAYNYFLRRMKKWFNMHYEERKKYKRMIVIFHGVEFMSLLILLSFIHQIFLFMLVGFFVHMIADLIEILYKKEALYSKGSQTYVYVSNKNKKEFR